VRKARQDRGGTRSAIFARSKIRLIIVDEEQENSYKQEETPRYHGGMCIVRAKMEDALALLDRRRRRWRRIITREMENMSC